MPPIRFLSGVYSFKQWWKFTDNGRIDAYLTVNGPGRADGHTYNIWWRIDYDLSGRANDVFGYTNPANTWVWSSVEASYAATNSYPNPALQVRDCTAYCYSGTVGSEETPNGYIVRYAASQEEYPPSSYVNGQSVYKTDIVLWHNGQERWTAAYTQQVTWLKVR